MEETNSFARRIAQVQPSGLTDLVIRYEALALLMLEQNDVIMDAEARRDRRHAFEVRYSSATTEW